MNVAALTGQFFGATVIGTMPNVGSNSMQALVEALTNPSLSYIPIYAESVVMKREAAISTSMIMSQGKSDKSFVTDNVAPYPRTWVMKGYLRSLIPFLEGTLFFKPTLLFQKFALDKAMMSRKPVVFKTTDGEIVDVLIKSINITVTPKNQSHVEIDVEVQELNYLTADEGSLTDLALTAGSASPVSVLMASLNPVAVASIGAATVAAFVFTTVNAVDVSTETTTAVVTPDTSLAVLKEQSTLVQNIKTNLILKLKELVSYTDITLSEGDERLAVTGDLTLYVPVLAEGMTALWSTDRPTLISKEGVVTSPAKGLEPAPVVVMCAISKSGLTEYKTFELAVLSLEDIFSKINTLFTTTAIVYTSPDSASSVTQDIKVQFITDYGVELVSLNTSGTALSLSKLTYTDIYDYKIGTITRGAADENVTLTATFRKNGVSYVSTVTLTVKAKPLSANANLSLLSIDSGILNPSFSPSVTSYTASVPNVVTMAAVTGTKEDDKASIASVPTQPSVLIVGNNTITLTVTAESGATKAYTVVVTRSA